MNENLLPMDAHKPWVDQVQVIVLAEAKRLWWERRRIGDQLELLDREMRGLRSDWQAAVDRLVGLAKYLGMTEANLLVLCDGGDSPPF